VRANEKLSRPLWIKMRRDTRAWYKKQRRRWIRRQTRQSPENPPNEKQYAGWAD